MKIKKLSSALFAVLLSISSVLAPIKVGATGGVGTQSSTTTLNARSNVLSTDTTAAQILADDQSFATQYGLTISLSCPTPATQNGNVCASAGDTDFGALKVYSVMLIEELSKWPTDIISGFSDHTLYLVGSSAVQGPNGIAGQVAGVYYQGYGIVYNVGFNNSDYQRRIVQHEFFHLLDFQTRGTAKALDQTTWESYNPSGFTYANYSGSTCYEGNTSCSTGFETGNGFITSYAEEAYVEDVAETGAALMTEIGDQALEPLLSTDTVLANKVTLLKSFLAGLDPTITGSYVTTMHTYGQQYNGELNTFFGDITDDGTTHTTTIPASQDFHGLSWAMGIKGETDLLIVDGKLGDIVVEGGTLKGTGTVGAVQVMSGNTIAPGHSPGCLTMSSLTMNGTYTAQIGGTTACTEYDQLIVNGPIDVSGGILDTSLVNGFVPSVGNSFTVIKNNGGSPVAGTFSGLAEGATFTSGGVTYSISYKGGSGNDIVLTVTNVDPTLVKASSTTTVPKAPNTGFKLVAARPVVSLGVTVLCAATLLHLSRRIKKGDSR
jgi:hypothetical protein